MYTGTRVVHCKPCCVQSSIHLLKILFRKPHRDYSFSPEFEKDYKCLLIRWEFSVIISQGVIHTVAGVYIFMKNRYSPYWKSFSPEVRYVNKMEGKISGKKYERNKKACFVCPIFISPRGGGEFLKMYTPSYENILSVGSNLN